MKYVICSILATMFVVTPMLTHAKKPPAVLPIIDTLGGITLGKVNPDARGWVMTPENNGGVRYQQVPQRFTSDEEYHIVLAEYLTDDSDIAVESSITVTFSSTTYCQSEFSALYRRYAKVHNESLAPKNSETTWITSTDHVLTWREHCGDETPTFSMTLSKNPQ